MDALLFDDIDKGIEPLNPDLVNGFAMKACEEAEEYIHQCIECASDIFFEGLEYHGYRRMSPLEEYLKATEERSGKSVFDIARSDVYLVNYQFSFKGEKINKPIYLPYIRPGGLTMIRGSTFGVSPVLGDPGISIGDNQVFVHYPRARNTYKRTNGAVTFFADGRMEVSSIVHSTIYNQSKANRDRSGRNRVKCETTLVHYLFCKYGVTETFQRFLGTTIHLGNKTTVNSETYPSADWVICESGTSHGIPPKGVKQALVETCHIRIAIRRCDYDLVAMALIGGFYYVAERFPDRVRLEWLGDSHETRMWRIILGHAIGGMVGGEGHIIENIDTHINSIDHYVDKISKRSLEKNDIFVDNIYELFMYIITLFTQKVIQTVDSATTMDGKELLVLRYLLRDITEGIFRMTFKLENLSKRKTPTFKDVNRIIRMDCKMDTIMGITRHGEVNSVSSPNDNMFIKISSVLVSQNDSGNAPMIKAGKDIEQLLHSSIAEIGSYMTVPKSEPTGRRHVNPWLQLDGSRPVRRPEFADLLDDVQRRISRDR